jgi:hypothetical protein
MAEIVSLHGDLPINAPASDVIDTLKELLAKAERGEIRAVAAAYVTGNDCINMQVAQPIGTKWALQAAVVRLTWMMGKRLNED